MRDEYRELLELPIKTPMEYWVKYWEYYVERLEDEKETNIGLTGPRIVLEALMGEVLFHNSTKYNKEFFKTKINYWKKTDAALAKLFSKELNDLMQHHYKDDSKIYECCSNIIAKMNEGEYFDELLKYLVVAIENVGGLSFDKKNQTNQFTELIVSEFVANGFDLSSIKVLPRHLPSVVCQEGGKVIIAPDEYIGIKRKDYKGEKEYYCLILEKVDTFGSNTRSEK